MTASPHLDSRVLSLPDAAATMALGARLGGYLTQGDVVFLSGGLGAGKTTLARGAIQTWTGVMQETPSPTYTLLQIYDGPRGQLWHVDLYRLKRAEEALELGLEDAFTEAACLIEWPDRLGDFAPRDRLEIDLAVEDDRRRATLTGVGTWKARVDAI